MCSGTLQDYIEGRYQGPKFENDKKILYQLTKGLAHLHHMNIIHRDVKPTNILIFLLRSGNFEKPQIKLADFGISNILQTGARKRRNEDITNPRGTRGWMAPEMYHSKHFYLKADIFPLGCVFGYTLTGGKHPFGKDPDKRSVRIMRKDGTMLLVVDDLNTPQSDNRFAFELIATMLNRNPANRPTADEILTNHFFSTFSFLLLYLYKPLPWLAIFNNCFQ